MNYSQGPRKHLQKIDSLHLQFTSQKSKFCMAGGRGRCSASQWLGRREPLRRTSACCQDYRDNQDSRDYGNSQDCRDCQDVLRAKNSHGFWDLILTIISFQYKQLHSFRCARIGPSNVLAHVPPKWRRSQSEATFHAVATSCDPPVWQFRSRGSATLPVGGALRTTRPTRTGSVPECFAVLTRGESAASPRGPHSRLSKARTTSRPDPRGIQGHPSRQHLLPSRRRQSAAGLP